MLDLSNMEESSQPTLSIIVPALNEEENLEPCVREIIQAAAKSLTYEILIVNDGSSDTTGTISEALKKEFSFIRVFHNPVPMGLGYNYAKGLREARGKFVMMVPGDNEIRFGSLSPAFEKLGSYDILIPYTSNPQVRPWIRRVLSKIFTTLFNTAFGLRVRYFNGPCIHRVELLRKIPIDTSGFAYMAQILVRLIKSGATYTHVPMEIRPRAHGSSKAFTPRNVFSIGRALCSVIQEVYFSKQSILVHGTHPKRERR